MFLMMRLALSLCALCLSFLLIDRKSPNDGVMLKEKKHCVQESHSPSWYTRKPALPPPEEKLKPVFQVVVKSVDVTVVKESLWTFKMP